MAAQTGIEASSKPKSQLAQSQPVDPYELSRRLSVVLAEQKARSDRKRRQPTTAVAVQLEQHSLSSGPHRNDYQSLSSSADRAKTEVGITHKTGRLPLHEGPSLHHLNLQKSSTSSTQNVQDEPENKHTYRHIPKVAASQFASTTMAESTSEKASIHVLSRQAIRFHLDGPNANLAVRRLNDSDAPCEKNRAMKRAQSMRERQYKRNPIDKTRLPATSELDMALYPTKPCHMHQDDLKCDNTVDVESGDSRRMSAGSMMGRLEPRHVEAFDQTAASLSPEKPDLVGHPKQQRVDWTQSDETRIASTVVQPLHTRSELRKAESKWKLRGRLGSFGRHNKEYKPPTPPEEAGALDAPPKSPITGFLSRFKR
ncbi:hypothetical protein E4U42_001136 [Claviceps africana]|uniref:Uncharacterized protein n=1 Tax=Claviceps africana TaxID=83212 RepID=A0A8K0JAY8_9HYPO|nr:hypothetical protein E4U42_001136 [Claviceps africana]